LVCQMVVRSTAPKGVLYLNLLPFLFTSYKPLRALPKLALLLRNHWFRALRSFSTAAILPVG
jgi:hypothetical protein